MKRIALLLITLFTISVQAQISNLAELATGKLESFTAIKESNGNVYGYFLVSKLDKADKHHYRYEYVLLDGNLNKVSNGEFIEKDYRGLYTRFVSPDKIGDKLLLTIAHVSASPLVYGSAYNTFRTLDIKENKISKPFYFNEDKKIIEGERPNKKFLKFLRERRMVEYPIALNNDFIINESFKYYNSLVGNKASQSIMRFGIDNEKKWEYVVNKEKVKGEKANEIIDENNIVFSFTNKKAKSITIYSLDSNTGKEIFKYELENANSRVNHVFRMEEVDNNYVIVGKMSPYHKKGYNTEKALGVFRIELSKDGKELSKKYFFWNQASAYLPMDKTGLTKDKFRLIVKNYFIFKDGRISILTEKRKPNKGLFGTTSYRTADFVILNFDKDFNLTGAPIIEKDLSKVSYSDYLYSQKVNDGNGVVFFYNDHKEAEGDSKKKNWILGIVSLVNGKMNHEQIPMTSEDHFIFPYIAKEGYILLRELNKDKDYDQIRLEKLNY